MMVMIKMVAVGEDEGDAAGAIVVTRWRWMRGGWCGGEDGDVAVVVMVAGAKKINGVGLSFPKFLLVKYGENQEEGLVWDKRFEEWCINNPNTPTSRNTKDQENLNLRPKDYPLKDWLLTKVGHTNISEPMKKSLLKIWLIDCFREDVVKDPRERSFDNYKWMFDLEIDQLADEYELGIGKKGHMLEDIWENCRKVQGENTYWWHD
ncbi:hypothetical protein Tco_0318814 [Tanacetum coccineum]